MTIKEMIIKNFKYNFSKFKSLFVCSTFTVTLLFLYAAFYFNQSVQRYTLETPLHIFMKFVLIGMVLFSFIFLSYMNRAFIWSRDREFGLYLMLGMRTKDVDKLIRIESFLICGLSLVLGLILGSVLSKLFFMLSASILRISQLSFELNGRSYIFSLILFVVVNVWLYVGRKKYLRTLALSTLIQGSHSPKPINIKVRQGVLGFVMTSVSFVLLYFAFKNIVTFKYAIHISIVMCFLGIFWMLTHFGGLLIALGKRRYHKRMITMSSIQYRFSDYRKVLFIVSTLSIVSIVTISFVYSLYVQVTEMVYSYNLYDIQYVAAADSNNLKVDEIERIIEKNDTSVQKKVVIQNLILPLYYYKDNHLSLWDNRSSFISESTLNNILGTMYDVPSGAVISLRNRSYDEPWHAVGDIIHVQEEQFIVQEEIYEVLGNEKLSRIYDLIFVIILDDGDYQRLIRDEKLRESQVYCYLLDDKNKVEDVYNDLIEADTGEPSNQHYLKDKYDKYLKISSREIEYLASMSQFGFQFYIIGFVGLIMLITSGVVLHFKILSDVDDMKDKYRMLKKIGITQDEINDHVGREIAPLFYVPTCLGTCVGFAYIVVLFTNVAFYHGLLMDTLKVIGIYFLCQGGMYAITKKHVLNRMAL